jgi:O-antigen/teichoic acid export membrane protein
VSVAAPVRRLRLPDGARSFLLGGLASVAFPLSALVTSPLLARGLGPDGRGELAALLTPLTIAEAMAAVGTPLAAAYFVRSGADLRSVRRAGLWIVTVSGVGTALLLVAFAPALLGTYPHLVPTFRWLTLGVVVGAYIELYRGVRSGQEAYGRVNANYWLAALARLTGIVALALLGALTAPRVAVLSIAVGVVAGLTLIRRPGRPAGAPPDEASTVSSRRMLRFSLHTWAGVVSGSVGARLDQFFLIGLVTPEVLGIYAVAVTAAQVPMAFFPAVQRLFLNRAAASDDAAALTKAARLSATVALLMLLALEPVLPWAVTTVFGDPFAEAAGLAQVLVVGAALWGIGQSLSGLLIGVGRPGHASAADAVGVVLLGLCLIPLQAWLGVTGAALAVVASSAVATLLKAVFLAHGRETTATALLAPSPRLLWQTFTTPSSTREVPGE